MRMWPEAARFHLGSSEGLPRAHPDSAKLRVPVGAKGFGSFEGRPHYLGAAYLPERKAAGGGAPETEMSSLRPADALIELLRHSFSPRIVEAAGFSSSRLDFFSRMVREVPVRRLRCPEGLEHLDLVCGAVEEDMGRKMNRARAGDGRGMFTKETARGNPPGRSAQ